MRSTPKEQLEELLDEQPASIRRRERTAFDTAASRPTSVVLFGAGHLGRRTLAGLRTHGIEPLAFGDNNPALWGSEVDRLLVYPLEDAVQRFARTSTFVVTVWGAGGYDSMTERLSRLTALGCHRVVPFVQLYWKYAESFLPHYCINLPSLTLGAAEQIRAAFVLWADEASRTEYVAQVRLRLRGDFSSLAAPVKHEMYFPDDLMSLSPGDVIVDCGAFRGDTLQAVLRWTGGRFAKIVAFEPDASNYDALRALVESLPIDVKARIESRPVAVSDETGRLSFNATGTEGASVGAGSTEVECVSLDALTWDRPPTFIKMDIEGSEMEALTGAANVISASAPILAISAYHRYDHLWRLPLLMHRLSGQYRFSLRPHGVDGWDLVCYAIPKQRLREGYL
jgi:FkbM family methyltransferase